MATKRPAKKTASGKAASPKKSAAVKRSGAAEAASVKRPRAAKKGGGRKDSPLPSIWISGTLAVVGGKIGMQTSNGFVTLQQVVDSGQIVGLVFQPSGGSKSGAVQDMLDKLREFIETYGVGAIVGGVTTCFVES